MTIQIKRAYETASETDGTRVLVDRLWPRGISKERAHIDYWLKEAAPSTELRQWYHHDPEKWDEFKKRYYQELDSHPDVIEQLKKIVNQGRVTFIFGSKEETHNNAAALKEYLAQHHVHGR